eukprot:TRINITY_DN56697_c0_g1_i1.p2 TRINITY_DN56697_c0_g1~~TRINITY_DN56697_c0_g1_i1.p2  ORF type:complete len:104 (-),score=5.47 TRINITY_DN56697_c0_g1_i1:47-358(-)
MAVDENLLPYIAVLFIPVIVFAYRYIAKRRVAVTAAVTSAVSEIVEKRSNSPPAVVEPVPAGPRQPLPTNSVVIATPTPNRPRRQEAISGSPGIPGGPGRHAE